MKKNNSRGKFEEWIEENPKFDDGQDNPFDPMQSKTFRWVWCNLLPVLVITLVIDIAVTFIVPIEYTMEWWFRLKDVFSFICAILIFHLPQIFRCICSKF